MTTSQREWASVSWRDDGTPCSTQYQDGYFGEDDPAAEARHVFCRGLALPKAWDSFFARNSPFRILELGFGAGINFLQTATLWNEWLQQHSSEAKNSKIDYGLDYWGIECHPLHPDDLQRLYRHYSSKELAGNLSSENLSENLLRVWGDLARSPEQTFFRWQLTPSLRLTLLVEEVGTALARLPPLVDGCYADGFAPKRNPAMWSEKVFAALARCTRERTPFPQLASFSVAKSVVSTAEAYGFRTQKRKGLQKKRQVLQGFFEMGTRA